VAALREALKKVAFERDLAEARAKRLTGELQTLQSQIASLQADRAILQARVADRDRYVQAIDASLGWRIIESMRKLVGRSWKSS